MELVFHVHQDRDVHSGLSLTISQRDLEHEYGSLSMALRLWCDTKGLVSKTEPAQGGDGLIVTLLGDMPEAVARDRLAATLKRLNQQRDGLRLVGDQLV